MYNIPILLVTYKRKIFLSRLIKKINKINPEKLYLFSDGPRNYYEKKQVEEVRNTLINEIRISGKIYKLFSEKNIGIKYYEKRALEFALKDNPYVIYLEDDIDPTLDFFKFQEKLLPKYEKDKRIIGVAGYNFGFNPKIPNSYFLSRLGWSWGAGFYKRIIDYYDPDVKNYFEIKNKKVYKDRFIDKKVYFYLDTYLSALKKNKLSFPDLQLYYISFAYDKYFIVSKLKLVENIGFNIEGHNPFIFTYKSKTKRLRKINHPKELIFDPKIEKSYYDKIFTGGWLRLIGIRIYLFSPKWIKKIIEIFSLKILRNLLKNV